MKKSMIFVGLLAIGYANAQEYDGKVGINTNEPKATLDITPEANNLTGTTNEGIIAPRLSKTRIANIEASKLTEGTLVYATDDTTNPISAYAGTDPKVAKITEKGYYFYNGTEWVKVQYKDEGSKWTNDTAKSFVKLTNLSDGSTLRPNDKNLLIADNGITYFGFDPTEEIDAIKNARRGIFYRGAGTITGGGVYSKRNQKTTDYDVDFYSKLDGELVNFAVNKSGQKTSLSSNINLYAIENNDFDSQNRLFITRFFNTTGATEAIKGGLGVIANQVDKVIKSHISLQGDGDISFHTQKEQILWENQTKSIDAVPTTLHLDKTARVGIGTNTPANKLHIVAESNPLRLEGLQASTTATDKILVADADGVVKTVDKSSISPTNSTVKATASEDTCTAANAGTFHYKERAVNGQQVGTMGFCTRQNGNYIWVYFSNGANVLQSAGTNKFGEGL